MQEEKENNNSNDANEVIIIKNQIKPESITNKSSENNLPKEQDNKIETVVIKVNQNNPNSQNNQNIQNNIVENNLKSSERFVTEEIGQKEIN